VRPDLNFRGYAGQIASGIVKPDDTITVLPSGRSSRVKSIVTYEGELSCAFPPMSVTLCLEDEIDISRGDMLVPPSHQPHVVRRLDARLVWMHERKLEIGHGYLLKHAAQTVRATVDAVRYRVNVNTLEKEPGAELGLNDIGAVVIQTQKPIFCDPYRRNRATGSFILIDPMTNATVGAGMITGREPGARQCSSAGESSLASRVSPADQESRAGHRAVTLWLDASEDVAFQLERLLFEADCRVHAAAANASTPEICSALNAAGVIALVYSANDPEIRENTRSRLGADKFLHIEANQTAESIHSLLKEKEIV
jgi:sulfate adenylyltransferase subunit 1 (EFTu-like GTPase family)